MKLHLSILSTFLVLISTMMCTYGDKTTEGKILKSDVVPWQGVMRRTNNSEIVLLCLVNAYDPEVILPDGDLSAAQMLDTYLSGVRDLGKKTGAKTAGDIDYSKKVSIYIVEGGVKDHSAATREKAEKLHAELGIRDYDRSIPVIYVFQKGKIIEVYTYEQHPGAKGIKLRDLVVDKLSPAKPAE
jgi:hypothetical protein